MAPRAVEMLTPETIDMIILEGYIKPFKQLAPLSHTPVGNAIRIATSEKLRLQLQMKFITPDAIPELIKSIEMDYVRSRIEPGDQVGILAAEAIGHPVTQASLGKDPTKKNLKGGTSTLFELIQASRNRKSETCNVFFKDNMSYFDVLEIADRFVQVTLDTLVLDASIIRLSDPEYPTWWNRLQRLHYKKRFPVDAYVLRITLDMVKVLKHDLTMEDIRDIIFSRQGTNIAIMHSPQEDGIIDLTYLVTTVDSVDRNVMGIETVESKSFSMITFLSGSIGSTVVKGVPITRSISSIVKNMIPVKVNVHTFVRSETLVNEDFEKGSLWEISWRSDAAWRYGVNYDRFKWLCENSGIRTFDENGVHYAWTSRYIITCVNHFN